MPDGDKQTPASNPAPVRERNFVERNLGTLLTFAAALVAAFGTLSGGLFKPNQSPVARITLVLGDQRVVVADGASSLPTLPIVPLGRHLLLSGAASVDPDGDIGKARFFWSVGQVYPEVGVPAIFGGSGSPRASDRVVDWLPEREGVYEAVLNVTNDHECNSIVAFVAGGGCHKTAAAVLHFAARRMEPPTIRVAGGPTTATAPMAVEVDADASSAFDDGNAQTLRFSWTLDDSPVSDRSKFSLTLGRPGETTLGVGKHVIEGSAVDRWGQASRFRREFLLTAPIVAEVSSPKTREPASLTGGDTATLDEHGPVVQPRGSDVIVPAVLDRDYRLDERSAVVRLPRRLTTNGKGLSIKAHAIVADGAIITSFDPGATPWPPRTTAAKGSDGMTGTGEGGAGGGGGKGPQGRSGRAGSDAGPIVLEADEFSGALEVRNGGSPGEPGGDGGDGGRGGAGSQGAPSSSSAFDCKRGPGRGGDGGTGGSGGDAGTGGRGGAGGTVAISFLRAAPDAVLTLASPGGAAGVSGMPGARGSGGQGGTEGPSGGWCVTAGRFGNQGDYGAPGIAAQSGIVGSSGRVTLTVGASSFSASGSLHYPPVTAQP